VCEAASLGATTELQGGYNMVTGLFARLSVHPYGRIQRFLLIPLKPSTIVWMFLTTHVTVCVCRAKLKDYLLTYKGRNVLGAN